MVRPWIAFSHLLVAASGGAPGYNQQQKEYKNKLHARIPEHPDRGEIWLY
jgi:hypothetical protein